MREDVYPELFLPTARVMLAGGSEEERGMVRMFLQLLLAMTALRTADEEVRVRWFKGPIGAEWSRLAGSVVNGAAAGPSGDGALAALSEDDRQLLGLLMEGMTSKQIAERMGAPEDSVRLKLQEMFTKIGASSRGEATAYALSVGVL